MKNLIVLLMLVISPLVGLSAPENSPLYEFDGGPRNERQDQLKEPVIDHAQFCDLADSYSLSPYSYLLVDNPSTDANGVINYVPKCELV